MEEFICKASKIRGIEAAVRFAQKSRALGLGVLGYHTYLQHNMISFDSLQARIFNHTWAKYIKNEAQKATEWMAQELGEPEWCKGFGVRNTHLLAIAPTTSNAIISGGVSQGIEPIVANAYVQKTAKGTFIRKNPTLEQYLDKLQLNTDDIWEKIIDNNGSISDIIGISEEAKEVFKTAYEINQKEIIFQANQRQKYICQAQSLNLFFDANESPEWIHKIHKEAAMMPNIKSLYYVRSMAGIKAEKAEACKSCEG
jgi:ribonucleoside-diphosphate reductase alpha chain